MSKTYFNQIITSNTLESHNKLFLGENLENSSSMFQELRKHIKNILALISQSKHLHNIEDLNETKRTLDSQSKSFTSNSNTPVMCSENQRLCLRSDSRRTLKQKFPSKSSIRLSSTSESSLSSFTMGSSLSFSSSRQRGSLHISPLSQWLWSMFIFLMLMAARCEGNEAVGDVITDSKMADEYLSTFGYYGSHHKQHLQQQNTADTHVDNTLLRDRSTSEGSAPHTDTERHHAVERLQSFFHLPVTGQLDEKTKEVLKTPRCGREDIEEEEEEEDDRGDKKKIRKKRYLIKAYIDGTYPKWKKSIVTWRLTQPTRQIPESQQREAILKAFAIWSKVVPVRFVEDRSREEPDINIKFARGEHGPPSDPVFDGNPSDGKNVLGHAWPAGGDVKGLAGDVHIDDDDDWSDPKNVFNVFVHELGHTMGLLHSTVPEAVMFPTYKEVTELHPDDIAGIKALYGSSSIDGRNKPGTWNPRIRTQRPYPRYTTSRPDVRHRTNRPDSRLRTQRPDPRYRTKRPNNRYRTRRPEYRLTTTRPETRYRTNRPDPRYRTNRPDPKYRTNRPDPRYRKNRPDSRYRTDKPDSRYKTNRPDPRYRTIRPDSRYRTDKPNPRYRTNRPDPRYRTNRPDSRYRTDRPDSRYRTNRPDNRGRTYTVRPQWVTTPTTPTKEDICRSLEVRAVFEDPSPTLGRHFLAISGDHVHRLTDKGGLIDSSPMASEYPDVPADIDVAFSVQEKKTVYFIKDNQMWAYKLNKLQDGYPRSLHGLKFPERPKFSLTLKETKGHSRLLLFGETYWWTFDVDTDGRRAINYDPISVFSRYFPRDIMFAARWSDDYLYAVTSDSYFIMDVDRRQIIKEEPTAGKPKWLHALCGDGSRIFASAFVTTFMALISMLAIVNNVIF